VLAVGDAEWAGVALVGADGEGVGLGLAVADAG